MDDAFEELLIPVGKGETIEPMTVVRRIGSDLVRQWIADCGERAPLAWATVLPRGSAQAVDLVSQLLRISPWRRPTTVQALRHPYMHTYHDEQYEPDCPAQVIVETDRIERLNMHQIKAELEAEVGTYQRLADTNHVSTVAVDDVHMADVATASSDAKAALREALVRRQEAKQAEPAEHQLNFTTSTHPKITAHERRLEREERRRRKAERLMAKEREAIVAKSGVSANLHGNHPRR